MIPVLMLLAALALLVVAVLLFDRSEWLGLGILMAAAFLLVFGVGIPGGTS